jgi:deoxycytidylate deaminase
MHTDLGNKVTTLLENHAELQALIQSAQFNQFDADTQLSLLKLHEEVDALMNSINRQVDALDLKIADMLSSLNL